MPSEIKLSRDELVSLLDYNPETGDFFWRKSGSGRVLGRPAGSVYLNGYRYIGIYGRPYMAHRLAWLYVHGRQPVDQLDHINGDRADNRISNLREANQVENSWNKGARPSNTSGFKGVCWYAPRGKWVAKIKYGGKNIHLGYFEDPAEGGAAYARAARELHGKFARTE